MKTILMILGKETNELAKGTYNKGLFDAGISYLKEGYEILTTDIENGYEVNEEIEKFKKADTVIFQYPVYWFMMPASLKKYLDDVYQVHEFFGFAGHGYGSGGLMKGKKFMLSTTWNAPVDAFSDQDAFFGELSANDVLLPMVKTNTFCGFEELPHFSCHNVIHEPDFARDEVRFLDHLKTVFA